MSADLDQMPNTAQVQFNCTGTAVGKMRNELAVDMVRPFHESFHLASDEGPFHGGDASAPPPLALFVAGLTGCLMTQIRAFAKRLGVVLDDLQVDTRVVWDWQKAGRVYETAPHSFEIDVRIDSPNSFEETAALVRAAQKGCFLEQTLGQRNTIRHRIRQGDAYVAID
ncbi:MAG: OsmC family protein [Pseudomonadota bacterium]